MSRRWNALANPTITAAPKTDLPVAVTQLLDSALVAVGCDRVWVSTLDQDGRPTDEAPLGVASSEPWDAEASQMARTVAASVTDPASDDRRPRHEPDPGCR